MNNVEKALNKADLQSYLIGHNKVNSLIPGVQSSIISTGHSQKVND